MNRILVEGVKANAGVVLPEKSLYKSPCIKVPVFGLLKRKGSSTPRLFLMHHRQL